MKRYITIPSIIIIICLIICFLFLGLYIRESTNWTLGVFIENFSEDEENKFLATYDLDKYNYVELLDVYYEYGPLDPYYIISFKVPKSYVEEFENSYLTEYRSTLGYDFSHFLPNRDYSTRTCKIYFSYEQDSTIIYVKEHSDRDYYEYHIRNFGDPKNTVYNLIREQFDKKNYRVIGKLKFDLLYDD